MTPERDDKSVEQETGHPIGRSILERLRRLVDAGEGSFYVGDTENLFHTLYLTEREECVPSHLIGEDLMLDIIGIYYSVFDGVRAELKDRLKPKESISVFVQPDYYDVTFALMVTETRVLLKHSSKAWNFWWSNEEEMAEQLEEWYRTAEESLSTSMPRTENTASELEGKEESGGRT